MRTRKTIKHKKYATARLNFVLNPAEKTLLKEAAKKYGVNLTSFFRSLTIPVAEQITGRKVETF